jgi:hypothetical protein
VEQGSPAERAGLERGTAESRLELTVVRVDDERQVTVELGSG